MTDAPDVEARPVDMRPDDGPDDGRTTPAARPDRRPGRRDRAGRRPARRVRPARVGGADPSVPRRGRLHRPAVRGQSAGRRARRRRPADRVAAGDRPRVQPVRDHVPDGAPTGPTTGSGSSPPATELPFAGHPSIGTAWLLARLGRIPAGDGPAGLRRRRPADRGDRVRRDADRRDGRPCPTRWTPEPLLRAVGLDAGSLSGLAPARTAGTGLEWTYLPVTDAAVGQVLPDWIAAGPVGAVHGARGRSPGRDGVAHLRAMTDRGLRGPGDGVGRARLRRLPGRLRPGAGRYDGLPDRAGRARSAARRRCTARSRTRAARSAGSPCAATSCRSRPARSRRRASAAARRRSSSPGGR